MPEDPVKARERKRRYERTEKGKARKRKYQTESLGGYLTKRRWELRRLRERVTNRLEELNGTGT